jgi:hypothetical protein
VFFVGSFGQDDERSVDLDSSVSSNVYDKFTTRVALLNKVQIATDDERRY